MFLSWVDSSGCMPAPPRRSIKLWEPAPSSAFSRTCFRNTKPICLLSLAYYLVVNKDSALCNYREFAECTWFLYSKGVTSGSISRLLRSINKELISKFLNKFNQAYRKEHGEEISDRRFWALNSTSITSYSENISSVD